MWWQRIKEARTYLDNAAGVRGNPSSPHEEGRHAKQVLEEARTSIARLLEVQSDDIIFTSGATEANALAILGSARARSARGTGKIHALYLPSAHASVVENMKLLAEEGVAIEELPIRDAQVDIEQLTKMLRKETFLVSMDAVCGETGVIWNTREVKHAIGPDVLLHVDASQAALTEKMLRAHFGADLLTFDGSKVGALRGIGALIAHRTIPLIPLYKGGGQERGLRPGSEAPERAAKFAAALRAAAASREAFRISAASMRAEFMETVMHDIPRVFINEGRAQAPHILNLSFMDRDTDYLVALLDEKGFAVSTKSACETDSEEGSRAVFTLTGDHERARATLRISWGPGVKRSELTRFAKTLAREVSFIDSSGQR